MRKRVDTREIIPSKAITSRTNDDDRRSARRALDDREVNVLFTVDLLNEGVDLPADVFHAAKVAAGGPQATG